MHNMENQYENLFALGLLLSKLLAENRRPLLGLKQYDKTSSQFVIGSQDDSKFQLPGMLF